MAAVFDESGILPTDPGQLLYIPYNGHILSLLLCPVLQHGHATAVL